MLKLIKVSMMRNLRKNLEQSSSDEEEESSSSDESSEQEFGSNPVFQVGFLKFQYQKKDLIKETRGRFGQSLLDLSISSTSIYFIGSTKFYAEDTPFAKY